MANISLADQLEDAIERMIAEPDSVPPTVDLKISELLGIAAELRLLPDRNFQASLKAEFLGRNHAMRAAVDVETRSQSSQQRQARREPRLDEILPTLFRAGDGPYSVRSKNFAISAAIHAALIVLVATAGFWMASQPRFAPHATTVLLTEISADPLPLSINKTGGGGGGGVRDKLSESKGSLPRFAREQIAPPVIVVRNEQPKLPAEPTIVGSPELTMPPSSQIGNPLAAIPLPPSNGTGFDSGIGSGRGGGIGVGNGPGFGAGSGGGMGGGAFRVGGGVSAPRPIYDPDPDYSEEARNAKFQGTVLLWVVVGSDGRPRDIRALRSVGMGLDQKAVEAVQKWMFEPAMLEGHPVAVQINIEVTFHLY
jgi:TonB family protein